MTGAVGAIKDVFLGRAGMAAFNQGTFHHILDVLNRRGGNLLLFFNVVFYLFGQFFGYPAVVAADCLSGLVNSGGNFVNLEGNLPSVPLNNTFNHASFFSFEHF